MNMCFPETFTVIQAAGPGTGSGGEITSTPISLKYVHRLWAVIELNTVGTSAAVACVPQTDALVAFGSAAVLTKAVPHWVCADVATSPILVRDTDAVNHTTTGDALRKIVVFEIDPSAHFGTTEDCFRISLTAVAATDFYSIYYVIEPRYPAATGKQPSLIVD